jgi:cobalt-zinc-cadmium efflux system protein
VAHAHHHDHHHATGRILAVSLFATVVFVVVELWTGVWSGSLALISDAGHNFTDALALLLAMFGFWLQSKPADEQKTFGYHRGGVLAAFVNALALLLLSFYLLWESYERLRSPQAVHEVTMMVVAGLGLMLNVGILLGLRTAHRHDLNIRAAAMHMMGDALGSVAIIIGAIGIQYTGWLAIDPVLSILISLLIIWTALDIVRDSLNILLEGLPKGMELQKVVGAMREVPGVLDVHDVHIWSLGSTAHALSCHARIADVPPSESGCILKGLNDVLASRFHIHHTTIQFEHENCGVGENGTCCIRPAAHSHEHSHAH